ncbi:MAG: dihydropyrimidinase, partial [Firmicutes bacterium]|nr:dihydropyrimidinase [Bacillota bacterium]
LVVVDPERSAVVDCRNLPGNADYSVYEGMELRGWPVMTISRGEIVMRDGKVLGRPGRGKFVERRLHAS